MPIERNEPCPCGSGRKAKKCCHGARQAPAPSWNDILETLVERLFIEAKERFDDETFQKASDSYAPNALNLSVELSALSVIPWLLAAWRPESADLLPDGMRVGESLAERLLRKNRDLRPDERRLLEAWVHEPASWWVVDAVDEGVASLRDAFRGMTRRVRLPVWAAEPGHALHARVLDIDGAIVLAELAPITLPPEQAPRIDRMRSYFDMGEVASDPLLRTHETALRLSLMAGQYRDARDAPVPLGFACIEPGAGGVRGVLARLTTGLEHEVDLALRALDEDGLSWRDVHPETGLPLEDGGLIIRRGMLLELRVPDYFDDFAHVRDRVVAQLQGSTARMLTDAEALAFVLDGIVPEPDPLPERSLLRRLVAMEREAWGDSHYARGIAESGYAGQVVLPMPATLEFSALRHALGGGPSFLPGDDIPRDWKLGEPPARRAERLNLLDALQRDALERIYEAKARPWRVVEVLGPKRVSLVAAADQTPSSEPVVASLPLELRLIPGDELGGLLVTPHYGEARFVLVEVLHDALADPHVQQLLDHENPVEWLDEALYSLEYTQYHEHRDVDEVYSVAHPEILIESLPAAPFTSAEDLDDEVEEDDYDEEEDDDESLRTPLQVTTWTIARDDSGALLRAEALIEGEVLLSPATATLSLENGELRLSAANPVALSAWRADLARLSPPAAKLIWLRQDRRFPPRD